MSAGHEWGQTVMRGTARRWLLPGTLLLGLLLAITFALTPLHAPRGAQAEASCGSPVEVLWGRGPSKEGNPPGGFTDLCVTQAEQQVAVSGIIVLCLSIGVSAVSVVSRRQSRSSRPL